MERMVAATSGASATSILQTRDGFPPAAASSTLINLFVAEVCLYLDMFWTELVRCFLLTWPQFFIFRLAAGWLSWTNFFQPSPRWQRGLSTKWLWTVSTATPLELRAVGGRKLESCSLGSSVDGLLTNLDLWPWLSLCKAPHAVSCRPFVRGLGRLSAHLASRCEYLTGVAWRSRGCRSAAVCEFTGSDLRGDLGLCINNNNNNNNKWQTRACTLANQRAPYYATWKKIKLTLKLALCVAMLSDTMVGARRVRPLAECDRGCCSVWPCSPLLRSWRQRRWNVQVHGSFLSVCLSFSLSLYFSIYLSISIYLSPSYFSLL